MATTQTVLQGKDTATQRELYISFELGDKSWKLTFGDGRRGPGRYNVAAGDTSAVLECVSKARARCGLSAQAKVHCCYEAGRDGWWLHRWLSKQGIDNIVVDAASIEVNRRARRAKTDRLDGDKLLAMLLRHHGGERVWSVLHEPTLQDEDARRTHRELARLMHERTAHTNRISSLLVLHNLRPRIIIGHATGLAGGRAIASRSHLCCELSSSVRARGWRWSSSRSRRWKPRGARRWRMASSRWWRGLARLRAIGPKGAWVLVKELFGWRRFANRRELAGCLGLAPFPYDSGDSQFRARHQQGRQQTSAGVAGGARLGLAAIAAPQRLDPVVQPTLRCRWQAHAARRHRRISPAPGHRAVALSGAR